VINSSEKRKISVLPIILNLILLICTACGTSANNDDIVVADGNADMTKDSVVMPEFVDKNESEYNVGDVSAPISDATKERLRWENLKTSWPLSEYLDGLGHSVEYGLAVSPPTYTWYPDGTEKYSDGRAIFLFSGPVWEKGSVCVGISVCFDEILPDRIEETISKEEMLNGELGNISWENANGEHISYYVYEDAGIVCKLPASVDGKKLLWDETILIQNEDANVFRDMPCDNPSRDMPLPLSLRTDDKWNVVNRYVAKLGLPKDEIVAEIASGGEEINALNHNVYRDYDSGVEYFFDAEICDSIYLTFDKAFPYFDAPLGTDFLEDINLRAFWGYDYASYIYTFEDCSVMVFTDGDRIVYPESFVIIG
jgi:hypothetical protein